jgi:iron complex outermembrane recepter protein
MNNTPQVKVKPGSHRLAIATLVPILYSLTVPVSAQVLEEVVVVARKRVENLQDTPVAVTAFGAQDMRAAQINNLADLSQQVPGLSNTDGAKFSGLTIRGVGARVNQAKVDPGVGVYVDGLFIPRGDTQLVDVVDMESIQVLRGPQGTLFGKNTAGGAILMSSKKPGEEFEGSVNATLGDYDQQDLSVRLGGPLIEGKLYGALTYDTRNSDGYMEDYYTGTEYGDIDRQAVVGQLRYLPTDSLIIDFIALWGEQDERAAPRTCVQANPSAALQNLLSPTSEVPYGDLCQLSEDIAENEKVVMDVNRTQYRVTNNLAGLTLDWEIGDFQLKSITGYLYQDGLSRDSDQEASPYFSIGNFSATSRQISGSGFNGDDEERRFVSQEFNLFGSAFDDKLDYTLGIYGSDEKIEDNPGGNSLTYGGYLGSGSGDNIFVIPPTTAGLANPSVTELTGQSLAAFGQLIYYFSDMWQFTLGARYTWEEKKIKQDNFLSTAPGAFTATRDEFNQLADALQPLVVHPDSPRLEDDKDWTEVSPSATVTLFAPDSWTDGLLNSAMFYFTYSEGFKAGGFSEFGGELFAFDPETVKNYELGFKMEILDQRIRLNGALYSMDYDDMQLGVTRTFGELNSSFGITTAGSSEVDGAELELSFLPLEGLFISFTASYIDASFNDFEDEFVDAEGEVQLADRSDEPFAYLPEQTYSWVIQYDWDTDFALITPRVSGYYKDEVYIGQEPRAFDFVNGAATLDSYTVWNARLAFESHQLEGFELAVFANNFTDEFYYGTGNLNAGLIGASSVVAGKPRHYGVEFYYSW